MIVLQNGKNPFPLPLPEPSGRKRICAVIPVYNNGFSIRQTAIGTLHQIPCVLILDDGSTDTDLKSLLNDLPVYYCRQTVNQGKGAALRRALHLLAEAGFDYMITLDADGQHDPANIPAFLHLAETGDRILAVGCRDFQGQPVPAGSKLGRKLSNLLLKAETGIRSEDCQSGFRMYPVRLLANLPFRCSRFDFEAEVLAEAAWAGADFHDLPVKVYYPPPHKRISHFRPVPELSRLIRLHFRLLWQSRFRKQHLEHPL